MATTASLSVMIKRDLEEQLLDNRMTKWILAGGVTAIILLLIIIIMLYKLLMKPAPAPVVIQQQATKVCMNSFLCACIHIATLILTCNNPHHPAEMHNAGLAAARRLC